jgi:hypothetical protein
VNQFSIITELLGTPPDEVIETIASENVHDTFDSMIDEELIYLQTLAFVKSLPKRERVPFSQKIRTADADGPSHIPTPHLVCSPSASYQSSREDVGFRPADTDRCYWLPGA